jgi:hypothetical protein
VRLTFKPQPSYMHQSPGLFDRGFSLSRLFRRPPDSETNLLAAPAGGLAAVPRFSKPFKTDFY